MNFKEEGRPENFRKEDFHRVIFFLDYMMSNDDKQWKEKEEENLEPRAEKTKAVKTSGGDKQRSDKSLWK